MATPYSSLNQAGFKAPADPQSDLTDKERLLIHRYGDLHTYIPQNLNQRGVTQAELASQMNVSAAWLSKWLSKHGYTRVRRWERD